MTRDRLERRQVIVLGMHRSGTSAVTGLLGACGAHVGAPEALTKPNLENPKGFFERQDARAICDALLHAAEADWWRVRDFEVDRIPPAIFAEQAKKIERLVTELDRHGTWALKEPRLCVLLPVFRRFLRHPVALLVVRHPVEVARSLRRRNGFPRAVALALWEAYVVAALRHSADMPRISVSYADLVRDPHETTKRLTEDLDRLGVVGLGEAPSDVIDPSLYRERASDTASDALLSAEQRRLWDHLSKGEAPPDALLSLSKTARVILEDFEIDRVAALERAEQQAQADRIKAAEAARLQTERHDAARALSTARQNLSWAQERATALQTALEAKEAQATRVTQQLHAREQAWSTERQRLDARAVDLQTDVERLQAELRAHTAALQRQEAELGALRQSLVDLERRLSHKDQELRIRNQELTIKARHIADKDWQIVARDREVARLVQWMRALDHRMSNLVASKRWRAGDLLGTIGRAALFQPREATAIDPLRDVMRAFRTWERQRARKKPSQPVRPRATPASPSPAPRARTSPPATRRHPLTVAVLAWDLGHNPLGRAYLLAEALAARFDVVIVGPQFKRYGSRVWGPVRQGEIPIIAFPGTEYPTFSRDLDVLASRLECDVILACKPRMPSLQLGLLAKQALDRPLLVDVDDYELSFFGQDTPLAVSELSSVTKEPGLRSPYGEPWTRAAETLLPYADRVLVSNEALRAKFGGTVIPHARDERLFDPARYDREQIRHEIGVTPDDHVVFFGGTVRGHKGVVELATALRTLGNPAYKLCLLGVIPDRALEARIREAAGRQLIALGERPFHDLPRYLAAADLVCSLQDPASAVSRYQLPAKIIDALAMGVPVLASPTPPLEPLIHAGAVMSVAKEDLATALANALAQRDRRRAEQGARRGLFEEQYSYEAIGRDLEGLILGALGQTRQLPPDALRFQQVQQAIPEPEERVAARPMPIHVNAGRYDLVLFWKQHDSGLYGRRSDMLAKYLARHPDVRRVAVVEPPLSLGDLRAKGRKVGPVQDRAIAREVRARRLGLRDRDHLTFHTFVYDNGHPRGALNRWTYPREDEYLDFLQDLFRALDIEPARSIFWVFPVNERLPEVIRSCRPMMVVCDIVDDQRKLVGLRPERAERYTANYREVLDLADLAVTNCVPLQETMAGFGKEVRLLPNGCELASSGGPVDVDWPRLRAVPRPRLAYIGNLEAKIDIPLLERIATRRPDWHLALVGSTHANPEVLRLQRLPNVHFMGVVPHDEARLWLRHIDVALLPHLDTEQTRSMNPLKLSLYLAAGTPVVSTRIRNLGPLERYALVADSHDDFIASIEHALRRGRLEVTGDLEATLRANSWPERVSLALSWVAEIVDGRRTAPRAPSQTAAHGPHRRTPPDQTMSYQGTCSVCGTWNEYRREGRSIRETFLCRVCRGSLRYRGQAAAILAHYGTPDTRCMADLPRHESFRRLSVYEPGVIGPFRQYLKDLPGYRHSYFWPDVPPGATREGTECQDLQRLTYADESFDLVITSDIFEHIRRPYLAFREIARILKPGGRHIFSVPLMAPMPSQTVFRVDTSSDEDRFLLPPHYHGAPMGGRSLVYTEFGADMLQELSALGLPTAALALETPHDDLRALLTFVSSKPLGTPMAEPALPAAAETHVRTRSPSEATTDREV